MGVPTFIKEKWPQKTGLLYLVVKGFTQDVLYLESYNFPLNDYYYCRCYYSKKRVIRTLSKTIIFKSIKETTSWRIPNVYDFIWHLEFLINLWSKGLINWWLGNRIPYRNLFTRPFTKTVSSTLLETVATLWTDYFPDLERVSESPVTQVVLTSPVLTY